MAGADDFARAKKELEEMAARLKNPKPVLTVAAQDLTTFVDDRFETSTGPDGSEWKELDPRTVAARRGQTRKTKSGKRKKRTDAGSVQILVDTGRLRQSIATKIEGNTLTVGTNVEYAGVHQFGGEDVPARPYLPVVETGEGQYAPEARGPAGKLWADLQAMFHEYVTTGKIR